MTAPAELPPSSALRVPDLLRESTSGVRGRPGRAVLSLLGIAVGVTAMVAVLGISAAGQAGLLARISSLGTNMLTVSPGRDLFGGQTELPIESVAMVGRIDGVQSVSAVGAVPGRSVRRTDKVDAADTNGIAVLAARLDLLGALGGSVAAGSFLTAATERYPAVVLGSVAASRLGIGSVGDQVHLGDRWFTVTGLLAPLPLAPEVDRAALIGWPVAREQFGFSGHPTTIYERSTDEAVADVRAVLAATVNPESPENVVVSRPSDALTAQLAARSAFDELFLGLGAVSLLVGGIGVANTMIISVLERRGEIGMRRSLGATRGHVRAQFLAESAVMSALGGGLGVLVGIGACVGYSLSRDLPVTLPWAAVGAGLAAAIATGLIAGLYPAARAARLSPTEALAAG
ncbi:ABC transporter permease [Saccharothrix algeriensis]|uniref:ABC transport system permease protein n=1 Tax=Saccharothrix algeriensis TaxID=173560 RepID=A0ABS2SDH4_9PSEU|nr:ABC transporter permease [Saccharothrix algeriensis]MBM7814273.1 putative ABC transport system permease protein [Saccharothrix algeriensis]